MEPFSAEWYQQIAPGFDPAWYSCFERFSLMTDDERARIRQELAAAGKIPAADNNASAVDSTDLLHQQ